MEPQTIFSNRLPHITPLGGTFFLTFRLKDALPRQVLRELEFEFESREKSLPPKNHPDYELEYGRLAHEVFKGYEQQLDHQPYGSCLLERPALGKILADRLREFHANLYHLIAYCIMPNHVHLVIRILPLKEDEETYTPLPKIMNLIKGGSARYINQYLGKKGALWAKDYFDRYMRSEKHLENVIQYTLYNPVKAGLVKKVDDWPFTYWDRRV